MPPLHSNSSMMQGRNRTILYAYTVLDQRDVVYRETANLAFTNLILFHAQKTPSVSEGGF